MSRFGILLLIACFARPAAAMDIPIGIAEEWAGTYKDIDCSDCDELEVDGVQFQKLSKIHLSKPRVVDNPRRNCPEWNAWLSYTIHSENGNVSRTSGSWLRSCVGGSFSYSDDEFAVTTQWWDGRRHFAIEKLEDGTFKIILDWDYDREREPRQYRYEIVASERD